MNEYMAQTQKVTQDALSFLDITEEDYINSFKQLLQTPENQKVIESIELEIRNKHEPKAPMTKTKDEYKRIYCEKLQLDAQCDAQVAQQAPGKPPQIIQQIIVTNKTRVLDTIYMKYGLKAVDITRVVEFHELDKDPDVESIKKANKQIAETFRAQQQKAQQDLQKDLNKALDDDFRNGFEKAVKELGALEVGPDALIKFDSFLKIQQLIGKFVHDNLVKRIPEHKKERREFLRGQQEQKY